ncbi:sugar phosphate isomerase/epimerase family protein [Cohnella fermenti]|nr:sugar phosphate isomerase/epimerase family protein [Cohnella fermenti]
MKYAFVSFSCPNAPLASILRMAQEYGYAGFEARCGFGHAHGIGLDLTDEQIADIRRDFAVGGISLACLSVSCHYSNPLTVDLNIDETKAYIRLAQKLDVPFLRVFCGVIPSSLDREEARRQVAQSLRELAPVAEQAGVHLLAETHDDWSDPKEMAAVMREVNHPSVGVVWDVMHTLRGGGTAMEAAYRILEPWIRHVHIHDGLLDLSRLTFLPIGEGDIDHRPVVRILLDHGYEGFVSGEWLDWEPAETHLPREIEAMRRYENEILAQG